MNFNNLYTLVTHEDSLNIHKTLGTLCILIYSYKFASLCVYHSAYMHNFSGIFIITIHLLLNITSLIFNISKNRNNELPIIYQEYRAHNTLFVFRSVGCYLCFYYNLNILYNMMICFMTMVCADSISKYYKSSTTTMRLMPYMDYLDTDAKRDIIKMHSFMQIVATYYMIGNIDTVYTPIFAIQVSSFLMTLVKKGIMTTQQWHYIYSLSLWVNIFAILSPQISFYFIMNISCCFMYYWRIINCMNKYAGWVVVFSSNYIIKELILPYIDNYIETLDEKNVIFVKYVLIYTTLLYYHIKFYDKLIMKQE